MNRHTLLHQVRRVADAEHSFYEETLGQLPSGRDLVAMSGLIAELNGGICPAIPDALPEDEEECLATLRLILDDKVTPISFWMSQLYPAQYLFYRSSALDDAIAQGISTIEDTEVAPVGATDWDQYEALNDWLWWMAEILWPQTEDPRSRLMWLLYDGLGMLFDDPGPGGNVWLCSAPPDEHEPQGEPAPLVWAAHPKMTPHDVVLMYRTAPVNAITDVFTVFGNPWFNPWSTGHGFSTNLEPVGAINPIGLTDLTGDQVTSQWNATMAGFDEDGIYAVPPAIYNRILTMVEPARLQAMELGPIDIADHPDAGTYASADHFAQTVVQPTLHALGFTVKNNARCTFQLGPQRQTGRIDHVLCRDDNPVAVVHHSLGIRTAEDLDEAKRAVRSWALQLGVSRCVVAAPHKWWIYALEPYKPRQILEIPQEDLSSMGSKLTMAVLGGI